MVRVYKKKVGGRVYQNYTEEMLKTALQQYRRGQITLREAGDIYNIPKSTLQRHSLKKQRRQGGQTALTEQQESTLIELIVLAGEWGYPMEKVDIRLMVKSYLDRRGVRIPKFNGNLPGGDWVLKFLERHRRQITERFGENIKRCRAAVSHETINSYFDNLENAIRDVSPAAIINYDETCFVDDPGKKKVVVRRGTKHPERVMDSTKTATSVMFSVSASGELLPPFVVYKSEHLYELWMHNGPKGTRYGRNKSGWFDQPLFDEWFTNIALPYLRRQDGDRVVIGDNLASHLSFHVIQLCEENNIRFCFLPPNSTHLTQPLDVAVFRLIKTSWRQKLEKWKKKNKGSLPKQYFPSLLL